MNQYVYAFDAPIDDNDVVSLVGAKAAGLREMTQLGIPVPPGFTLTTAAGQTLGDGADWPGELASQFDAAIAKLEAATGRRLGDPDTPLLVSVRSGSAVSMPGMMDTLLNVGLTDATLPGLAAQAGGERFALDSYRRLLEMFGVVVCKVRTERFQSAVVNVKTALGTPRMRDAELTADALRDIIDAHRALIEQESGQPFPQTAREQLLRAVEAVFASWDNPRARRYRAMQGIGNEGGTACTVQAMVFGNTGSQSGSGVAFTRNPSTGERTVYGEFLATAQGEDVVSGVRTPASLTRAAAAPGKEDESLEASIPGAFEALEETCTKLETHFGDMQDIEFTVEEGTLFILQTRDAKRSAPAAVRVAVDLVREGVLTKQQSLLRLDANCLEQLVQTRLKPAEELAAEGVTPIAKGLPASPGAITGRIVFNADEAVRRAEQGEEIILVRGETSSEDVHGMRAAQGVLTAAGGLTSHAAVVARGLGKCCVAGCSAITLDGDRRMRVSQEDGSERVLEHGDLITLDGHTGAVYAGSLDIVAAPTVEEFHELIAWADEFRTLTVLAEADTPRAARAALSYGAEGVGLCRTERMFFAQDRLHAVRCALLADSLEEREPFLHTLEEAQREDFLEIFVAMEGRPVQIRLLDRPLHAFMPTDPGEFDAIAESLDMDTEDVALRVRRQAEANPLLGHRGVRSGLTVAGLYEMQLRAMLSAATLCAKQSSPVALDISIPMVAFKEEVIAVRKMLDAVAARLGIDTDEPASKVRCRLGVMMEIPRACLIADEIAAHSDFFAFGGNDLTRMTLGMSQQDTGPFLAAYLSADGPLRRDPFHSVDLQGVGEIVELALERARREKPQLAVGLCGEQGGDPESIIFAQKTGLSFVSSPLRRLPVARVAAAQAALRI